MVYATPSDLIWLNQRGGRNELDLHEDEKGRKYVMMYAPAGDVRVFLPNQEILEDEQENAQSDNRGDSAQ